MSHRLIHIDSVLSDSAYRWFFLLSVNIFLLLVILVLGLGVWYTLGLVVILLICNYFSQIRQSHLTAVSSVAVKSFSQNPQDFLEWQIQVWDGYFFVPYGYETDVYQANLQKIDDFGVVMLLKFAVLEPFEQPLSVQIWQDQVDIATWRTLKILAKMQ